MGANGAGAEPRRGLVLGGGAALGAYQAGALKAIKEAGVAFEVISATSIGALHAHAWPMEETLLSIDRHWLENVAGLRPFDPGRLLKGENPFQFGASLDAIIDAYRGRYRRTGNRVEILVTVTDYETCTPRVFSSLDPDLGPDERAAILKASTVLPHLGIPPVEVRGRRYFDGGYTDNLPLSPLEGRGLDEIWMIPLMPVMGRHEARRTPALLAGRVAGRIRRPEVRSLVTLLGQLLSPVPLNGEGTRRVVVAPASLSRSLLLFQPLHALAFSERNIRRLLELGHEDGRRVCRRLGILARY